MSHPRGHGPKTSNWFPLISALPRTVSLLAEANGVQVTTTNMGPILRLAEKGDEWGIVWSTWSIFVN